MLIITDDHLKRAGVRGLDEVCPSCRKPLREYPLLLSDEASPSVYHVACALQLATEILVDLFTFFSPPAPFDRLFVLTVAPSESSCQPGGCNAINRS
jgi:hypothetical protein